MKSMFDENIHIVVYPPLEAGLRITVTCRIGAPSGDGTSP